MTRRLQLLALIALASVTVNCFHATIDTGRPPSAQTIEQAWASSWVYGLVPPSAVSTAQGCPNGVSKVETQLSFVNQVVHILTLGIYTPMHIKVTCAAGGTASLPGQGQELVVPAGASPDEVQRALTDAAQWSLERKGPVVLRFATP